VSSSPGVRLVQRRRWELGASDLSNSDYSEPGPLAHLVEQEPFKLLVRGSSPRRPTTKVQFRGGMGPRGG
jgi:hypothetical protein